MTAKPRVYLAGAISGLSYEAATDWRQTAVQALSAAGIAAYSPMRAKDFLRGSADLTWKSGAETHPMATSKGIQTRDFNDCINADVLLVNLKGTTKASIGSCFEIAWAHFLRIPIVVVAEADNVHVDHPMAQDMINFRVDDMESALDIVKHILLPEAI